jgi:hypothetical protein
MVASVLEEKRGQIYLEKGEKGTDLFGEKGTGEKGTDLFEKEKRGQIYLKMRKRGQIYLMRCRSSFC